MTAKRIIELDPLSGAASSNDDALVIFDTSDNTTKRIIRSQLAEGLAPDLQAILNITSGTRIYTGVGDPPGDIGVDGDLYIDSSNGNFWSRGGVTWVLIGNLQGGTGGPGVIGPPGLTKNYIFQRSAVQPDTPEGNNIPAGWEDFPPAGADPLWTSHAWQDATGVTQGVWSAPIRLDGAAGATWYSGTGAPAGNLGVIGDFYLDEAIGFVYKKTGASAWTLIADITGPQGPQGPDLGGDFIEVVDVLPPLPDVNYPVGTIVILRSDGRLYQNQLDVWIDLIAPADLTGTVRIVAVLPVLPDAEYPIGSYVLLTTDNKLYRNDANVWVAVTGDVPITATIQTVGALPALPDVDYPVGTVVLLSTDGYLYQNQADSWVVISAPPDLTGAVRSVGALPALPDADYPVNSYVLLTTTNALYQNQANVWVEIFLTAETSAIIPVAVLPTLPDAGYPPGQTVYLETNDTLYINVNDVWEALTLTVTAAAGLPVVASLPALPNGTYPVGTVIYNQTDGLLYKNDDNATWTAVVNAAEINGQLQAAQIAAVNAVAITGQITTTQITDSAISTNKLAASSVIATKIAVGTITADRLVALTITADKIAANAVTTDKLAANSITAGKIEAGAIGVTQLAADAVTANKIAAGAITTAKLDAAAITADKIAANSVSTASLQAYAVTAINIGANAITTEKLNAGAVNADKIAADSVTASKIFAGSVTTAKLDAGAVTAETIAANAITAGKIAVDAVTVGTIAAGSVTATKLGVGSVLADAIAANAITTAKIQAGQVTGVKIAGQTITATNMAAGSITAANAAIADLTVTTAKIANLAISGVKIADGAITAEKILIGNYTNQLQNANFASGLSGWKVWSGVVAAVPSTTVGVPANPLTPNVARFTSAGVNAALFYGTNAYSDANAVASAIVVEPGESYYFSVQVSRSAVAAASTRFIAYYHRVDGTFTTFTTILPTLAATTSWVKREADFVIPTSGSPVIAMTVYLLAESMGVGAEVFMAIPRLTKRYAGELIVDGAITAAKITAGQVTADKLSTTLAYAGSMQIADNGHVRSGQTAYNTGSGWWLGRDAVNGARFSIGDAVNNYLTWSASGGLQVKGNISLNQELAFTPTLWTGFSVSPTGQLYYIDLGNVVVVYVKSNVLGTGDSSGRMELQGLPVAARPSGARLIHCMVSDNGYYFSGMANVFAASNGTGLIRFEKGVMTAANAFGESYLGYNQYGFRNTGTPKGLGTGWTIVYSK